MPKMVTLCFPKKIRHLRIKIDLGEKYYLECIGANVKAFTLQVYKCLNFPGLLGFLKITCDLMSGRGRRRNSGYGKNLIIMRAKLGRRPRAAAVGRKRSSELGCQKNKQKSVTRIAAAT